MSLTEGYRGVIQLEGAWQRMQVIEKGIVRSNLNRGAECLTYILSKLLFLGE